MSSIPLILSLFFGFCFLHSIEAIKTYYMDRQCGTTLDLDFKLIYAVRINLTSRSFYYSNMNCSLLVSGAPGDRLMVYFKDENIFYTTNCYRDSLQVKDGQTLSSPTVNGFPSIMCGYSRPSGVKQTSGRYLTLNFQSSSSLGSGFELIVTRFTLAPCFSYEYSCDNGRCIDSSISCNGYNPCGDHSDCPLAAGAIAGIVIGGFFFIVILVTISVILRRRRRRMRLHQSLTIQTTTSDVYHPPPGAPNYGTTGAGYNQPVPQQYTYPQGPGPVGPQPPPNNPPVYQ